MGNYYAGIMNSEAGRELRHHGIFGMHWYVRRFQNPDGSLTPAGRERYYGDRQREKIRSLVSGYLKARPGVNSSIYYDRIVKSPQTKAIGDAIKDEYIKYIAEQNKRYRESNKFYNNEKLHLKYADIVADEEFNEGVKRGWFNDTKEERESYKWQVRYEDGDQGQVFDRFIKEEPNHPIAKAYKEFDARETEHYKNMVEVSKEMAKEFLGSNASEDEIKTFAVIARQAASKQISTSRMDIPKTGFFQKSNGSRPDGSPRPGASTNAEDYGEKEFQKSHSKYMRGIGTEGILYGNRTNDPSVKVLDKFRSEQKSIGKVDKAVRKEKTRALESKYSKSYAEALLKSMGYDVNPGSIGWIMKQPWFSVEKDANTLSFNRIMSPSTVNTAAANAIANNRNR